MSLSARLNKLEEQVGKDPGPGIWLWPCSGWKTDPVELSEDEETGLLALWLESATLIPGKAYSISFIYGAPPGKKEWVLHVSDPFDPLRTDSMEWLPMKAVDRVREILTVARERQAKGELPQ